MGDAFTVYWPQDRWLAALHTTAPLEVLFGGPHTSLPSFVRATVKAGDVLYPIGVWQQVLHVFGRARVREITEADGSERDRFRRWRFLAPTCTTEVVHVDDGTRILGDRAVPGATLKTITYLPRRGPRPIKHVDDQGMLTRALSVQGIYRLAPESAATLEALVTGPATAPGRLPPRRESRWRPVPSMGAEPLF
ncbi:hypothetical protein [Actinoplanes sp. NPDC020271]|uniref:hypothetical protein n=1 Tax=Actinoplanes sp. NPDC020271 TaxID=3363896 RepID=UPI0037B00D29